MPVDRKLEWLEAMRGMAAAWVLFHHAGQSINHFVGDMGSQSWIERGFLGVDFFFVLSGFIIAFASQRLIERGGEVREYASARLVRVYVPYLPVGIAMLVLYQVFPDLSASGRETSWLTSLTLMPDDLPPALSVAWTLVHEVVFYSIYALRLIHPMLFRVVLTVWTLMILYVAVTRPELQRIASYFLSPLNLCFLVGVGVYHISRRISFGAGLAIALGCGGLALLAHEVMASSPSRILVATAFAILVLATTSAAATSTKIWRPLLILGSASYAVYLTHNPALALAVRVVEHLLPTLGSWLSFILISSVAMTTGLLYWRCYEQPALRWVRARVTQKRVRLKGLAIPSPSDR
jgi:exopolysaccharide production protein ExoZ